MKTKLILALLLFGSIVNTANAQKYKADVPDNIKTPNTVQTNPKESWFVYLRFYGPTERYFDESYPLQDVKLVK